MKKLIFFLFLFLIFFPIKSVLAANTTWYAQPPENWSQNIQSDGPNGEQFWLFAWSNILNNIAASTEGVPTVIGQGPNGSIYANKGGAIEIIASLSSGLFVAQPASSVEYLASLGQNLGIAKPAYAQGLGFNAFSPVLKIWKAFRDLAYLGFVIIFVVVGFMIMFRKKIDPRTVVTIQESLPRIVIALLLVTFSYALAGLIIDLTTLSSRLIGNVFARSGLIAIPRPDITAHPEFSSTEGIMNQLYQADIFSLVRPLASSEGIANRIGGDWFTAKNIGSSAMAVIGWLTFKVIFAILGFFVMFKIFFALLGPYVSVVLSVIFAPIQLLAGAIPGNNDTLVKWLRGLLANAAVFPVTMAMLLIAAVFKSGPDTCGLGKAPEGGWGCAENVFYSTSQVPTVINWWVFGIGGRWGNAVGELIGFGILFTIPAVAEAVKSMLEGKELPLAQIAGQEIKGGFGRLAFIKDMLPK
ncbi:MAG: hypothetical protein M1575_03800 [Patescibacteria group bacterium]|nr:hypothetical protein [Patescibacteria group bacterium]